MKAILLLAFSWMVMARVFGQTTVQKFAVIGDYGYNPAPTHKYYVATQIPDHANQLAVKVVADLVKSWNPNFIVSVGDDSYWCLLNNTFDDNVGPFYHDYISPYNGAYGSGSTSGNRFFSVLGNHDYHTSVDGNNCGTNPQQKWLDYFSRNTRYYDFVKGDIHFFAMNFNSEEPDGISATSTQALWLKSKLAQSTSKFNIVYGHRPPYSSCDPTKPQYCGDQNLRWPFKEWGADVVLTGDVHFYERLVVDGFTYVVNGLGGGLKDGQSITRDPASVKFYRDKWGAMLVYAFPEKNALEFQMYDHDGGLIDKFIIWSNKSQNCR